jgi:Fe-S-cluster formation regulator IscX/YfhJ
LRHCSKECALIVAAIILYFLPEFCCDFSRCDIVDILLEMDRILRPEGAVLMRDEVDVLTKVMGTTQGMRWECRLADHEDGPFNSEKILVCVKTYWVGEYAPSNSTTSD